MKSILFILLFLSVECFGQGRLLVNGWRHAGPGCTLLLGSYSGATAAYSLRKLDCSYSGSAIRVRRSSDDTEQDIGFDGDDLDETALIAFVGSGAGDDGFVVTWYDQSGNGNDASTATEADQPQIVDEGAVINIGGVPALLSTNDNLALTSQISLNDLTIFTVSQKSSTSGDASILFSGDVYPNYFGDDVDNQGNPTATSPGGAIYIINTGLSNTDASGGETTHHLGYYNRTSNQAVGGYNGSGNTPATAQTNNVTFDRLLGYAGSSSYSYAGYVQELIIYSSNKSSDRAGIESNINSYYSIF